jgi:transposase-like protein
MSGGSSRRYPPELRERAVRMVAEISDQHDSEWAAISEVARLLGVGTAETWILDQLRLHGNSHRFNTHHYQLTNASYSVAEGISLRRRRLCRCSMYLRLAHYFCSTECVRSLLVCQSGAIRIVSRRSGDVVADDGPRPRPTDWAERNFHELTEIFAGCGIITCVAAFTARDRRRMPLLELGAPGGRRGARRWGR